MNRWCIFLPGLLVLFACAPPPVRPTLPTSTVQVVTLALKSETPEVRSFGSLAFAHKADLTSVVEGTVSTPLPEEGHRVFKNQILCVLRNDQVSIQQAQARHEITAAQAGVELAKAKLWQARIQFETRRLALVKTQNQLKQKTLELQETKKILQGKEKLYELSGVSEQDLDALKLKVSADQTDLEALQDDYLAQKIGLRDRDIVAFGLTVPDNPVDKERILETINTTVEQANLDSAKANLEKAQGDVDAAKLLTSELTIRSPLSGVLGARYVERGERVTPGSKIATIFDNTTVDAVVPVREEEGLALHNGLRAQVWIDALGTSPIPGFVQVVSPLVDPTSGHFTVKVRLERYNNQFKPGLFARVAIPYGNTTQVLVLPQTTLIEKRNDIGRVFLVVNMRLIERRVTLGKEENGGWQVVMGLSQGDEVVNEPSPLLREGERVETIH